MFQYMRRIEAIHRARWKAQTPSGPVSHTPHTYCSHMLGSLTVYGCGQRQTCQQNRKAAIDVYVPIRRVRAASEIYDHSLSAPQHVHIQNISVEGGAAGATVDQNRAKTLQREAAWSIRRVGIGESKRKFRTNAMTFIQKLVRADMLRKSRFHDEKGNLVDGGGWIYLPLA